MDRLRVNKGYVIRLEPDKYPEHALLAEKLKKRSQWLFRDLQDGDELKPEPDTPVKDDSETILPHQALVLEEYRRKIQQTSPPE